MSSARSGASSQDASLRVGLSRNPEAVQSRVRRLNTDYLDRSNERARERDKLKAAYQRAVDHVRRVSMTEKGGWFEREVAHHVARGRDAGRIAVWMNVPVSRVEVAIASLRGAP